MKLPITKTSILTTISSIMPELKTLIWMLVAAVITLGTNRLFRGKDQRSEARLLEIKEEKEKVRELERQVAALTATAIPVQAFLQQFAISKLTNFHTPSTDELLKKVSEDIPLSEPEVETLKHNLEERVTAVDDRVDEEQRIYAKIFPDLARLRIIEKEKLAAASENAPTTVTMVAVPKAEE